MSMKTQAKSIPEFKSVEEELEFWDKHSALEFVDEGSVVEIDASKAREKRDRRPTQRISLRVSHRILQRTKTRARTLGVPYQTLIQLWIAERLEEEEGRAKSYSDLGARQASRESQRGKAISR